MEKILRKLAIWFETGDLIPLLILVSVPHYAMVLAKFDFWLVAAVLGLLVDIGHYRTIKAALRGKGWTWMIVLTILSFAFHTAFYWLGEAGAWAMPIGAAVPTVIFALAWISKTERIGEKLAKQDAPVAMPIARQDVPEVPRGTYQDFMAMSVARPMSAKEVVAQFNVPKRTAYNWLARFGKGEV